MLRAAFDAASLGDVPTALPDEYYGCRRAFAAAVKKGKPGLPLVLILDTLELALLRASWEIYGCNTVASADQGTEICDALGIN